MFTTSPLSAGALWVGASDGLWRYVDGGLVRVPNAGNTRQMQVSAISPDGHGGLWLGDGTRLVRWNGRSLIPWDPPESAGTSRIAFSRADRTGRVWIGFAGGRIVSFRTFMTGEVFGALKDHTILGRPMREGPRDNMGFARGVEEGAKLDSAGALLNRVFATRTYGLMDRLPGTALADYLSGLLIGAEVTEMMDLTERPVVIIASPALAARYTDALNHLGFESSLAPEDCVAAGHWQIARAAGLC